MTDKIDIRLYDEDQGSKPDLVSQVQLSFAQSLPLAPQWISLYGAPTTGPSDAERAMNDGSVPASAYRGQLLLAIEHVAASATTPAVAGVASVPAAPPSAERAYQLRCDVFEASEVPRNNEQLLVEVSNGRDTWSTPFAPCNNGSVEWFHQLPPITLSRNATVDHVPDFFINIVEKSTLGKDKRIAYYRVSAKVP